MFELRTLSADDWEEWKAVRLRALANAPDAFGSGFNDWANAPESRWRSRLSIRNAIDLVAYKIDETATERVVGMATGVPTGNGEAEIISMWVDPSFRGRGLASSLIGKIASWAVQSGFIELRLAVRPDNTIARSVYQHNSFIVSDEPGDRIPDGRREIIMVHNLRNNQASSSPTALVNR
ncbi:acyl-CoA N-acyltransferase [Trichoderma compactum]